MKMKKLLFAGLFGALLFTSCSDDDDVVLPPEENPAVYENGFFVLNQGSATDGSITFVGENPDTVQPNIYAKANPEEELGLGKFLQSMFFHEGKAYIISNGSNLITVVDAETFELLGKVNSGLAVPRYGAVINGKAYITNQASFDSTDDDFIAVVDLESLEVENTIPANAAVEFILEEEGKLYIQNAAYNSGNAISVLNPATGEIEEVLQVSDKLNSIEIEDGILYALSGTKIEKVDLATLEVSTLAEFPTDFTGASNLEIEDGIIYYTSADRVFSLALGSGEVSTTPLLEYGSESDFGMMYGFEVEDNKIYIADAGDFASNSFVQVYTISGDFIKEIEVGVAPNGFYFVD